jgi:uncharacterized lipoprotein NlpE involved in copper resistance
MKILKNLTMKKTFKQIIFFAVTCLILISCSNSSDGTPGTSGPAPLNSYETQLVGTWQYVVTPHPSGQGGPSSYYKTYFTLRADRTGVNGLEEYLTPSLQNSSSTNITTWSATATTATYTLSNGTTDGGNYQLIDATHVKMYSTDGTSYNIFTKQ